jgi:hypothetical protein
MIDFATRAYNQSFNIDPVIRSLLDTDVYKLLMLQFVWKWYPDIPVTFSLINRTRDGKHALVPEDGDIIRLATTGTAVVGHIEPRRLAYDGQKLLPWAGPQQADNELEEQRAAPPALLAA